ncbi:MAG: hypothetical protein VB071_11820 [Lawsonibacter sp.]|nr:hypothetical protein [Lawsonibacter sp.]
MTTGAKELDGDTIIKGYPYDANRTTVSILPFLVTNPSGACPPLH